MTMQWWWWLWWWKGWSLWLWWWWRQRMRFQSDVSRGRWLGVGGWGGMPSRPFAEFQHHVRLLTLSVTLPFPLETSQRWVKLLEKELTWWEALRWICLQNMYIEYECQSWNDVKYIKNREPAALKVLIALLITFSPIWLMYDLSLLRFLFGRWGQSGGCRFFHQTCSASPIHHNPSVCLLRFHLVTLRGSL